MLEGDSQERPERENGKESYVERQKGKVGKRRGRKMDADGERKKGDKGIE